LILLAFCLVLALPLGLVTTSALGSGGLLLLVPLLWVPLGWGLRSVRVTDDRVIEVRFWPFSRSWPRTSIRSVALIDRTIGWASLPATSVSAALEAEGVWFPSLQGWALTDRSIRRASKRVQLLAAALDVPWSDQTAETTRP
jgi:hypothetical protein